MRKLLYAATALGFAALAPTAARATVIVEVSVGGGAETVLCTSAGITCDQTPNPITIGGVTISGAAVTTNSAGTPTLSLAQGSSVTVSSANSAPTTVDFIIGGNGFTQPLPPASLLSSIGGSVTVAASANAVSMFSCAVSGGNETSCLGGTSTAPVTPDITALGSYNQTDTVPVSTLVAPYSLVEMINFTLGSHGDVGFQSSSELTPTGVPEPAALGLLGVGLLGLGFVAKRKRSV